MEDADRRSEILKYVVNGKSRAGKAIYIKYLKTGKINRNSAFAAKCFECDGWGESGVCDIDTCPLFPFSPYNKQPTTGGREG